MCTFDVWHPSALEALAYPGLLSTKVLPSRKGCVLQDLHRTAFPDPISKYYHPGISCAYSRKNTSPFFLAPGPKCSCAAWQARDRAGLSPSQSPAQGAGQHSSQGRSDTGKPKCWGQWLFPFRVQLHPDFSAAGLAIPAPSPSYLPVWPGSSRWVGS